MNDYMLTFFLPCILFPIYIAGVVSISIFLVGVGAIVDGIATRNRKLIIWGKDFLKEYFGIPKGLIQNFRDYLKGDF